MFLYVFNLLTKTNSYAMNGKFLTHHGQRDPHRLQLRINFVLALSIFSVPIISKADLGGRGARSYPLYIKCLSGC